MQQIRRAIPFLLLFLVFLPCAMAATATSVTEINVEEKREIVVVGAGIAGLAAASFLVQDGWDVLVLEKETRPGRPGHIGIAPRHRLSLGHVIPGRALGRAR